MKTFLFLLLCLSLYGGTYEQIIETKTLKIAMREIPVNYIKDGDKIVAGFNYELASEFAKYLGVKLEIVKVNKFKDFWTKDGKVILKMKPPATPDIFKKVDMTLDITSKNAKRDKYIEMIPYIKNKAVLFSHKDVNIKEFKDLIGKKIYLHEHMQSYRLVIELAQKHNIPYKIDKCEYDKKEGKLVFINDFKLAKDKINIVLKDKESKTPDLFGYLIVYRKFVDSASTDSLTLFLKLSEYGYLKNELEPSFPIEKNMGYLSATMPKEAVKLKKKFNEFVTSIEKNGFLDTLVHKHLKIGLNQYNHLLGYNEN